MISTSLQEGISDSNLKDRKENNDDSGSEKSSDDEEISSEELKQAIHLASEAITVTFGWDSKKKTQLSKASSSAATNDKANHSKGLNSNHSHSKKQQNILSDLIPGYVAPMKLDSSGLNPYKSDISTLISRTQQTDSSTKHATILQKMPKQKSFDLDSQHITNANNGATQSAGPQWFNMTSTPMSDAMKADLRIIANRNYLDPKKFYKSADKSSKSKVVQLGTVIEGTGEFYSNRLSKKDRRMNLTEELMNDASITDYTKKHFRQISNSKMNQGQLKRKGKKYKYKR